MARMKVSLMGEIEKIRERAAAREEALRELGVFIFFSDRQGDAWVLEVTDRDAVQVARAGEPLDLDINENPETIEINWSHTFVLRDKKCWITAYADGREEELTRAPTKRINAAIRRIYKRYSPEVLDQVYLRDAEQQNREQTA